MSTQPREPLELSADSVSIARWLCDVPSVSGSETALADALERALSAFPHLTIVRVGDTIVAKTELGRARRVVIAGHIDTVPVNNNLPTRFETDTDGDYLWGRGTVDMKSGVAVQLKLAAELTDPAVDITWVWYDHEEVDAEKNGLNRLSTSHPELLTGDFAILGEPSNGTVEGGCNGTARVELRMFGVRAHSARNWLGVNAIHKMAPLIERLNNHQAAEIDVDGLRYRESLSAVGITGGVAGNVIPDECVLLVNYRFAPDKSPEQAVTYLKELFADAEDVRVVDIAPGARPGLDAELAASLVEAVGHPAEPKYGWTDVARFAQLGVPAVNFGPGDAALAHTDNERVPITQILDAERVLREWLMSPSISS